MWKCRSDATCIICREEMTTAKKLLCGHLFHVHCLRSWLERQHTCPTCRAFIVPADNGTSGGSAARQQGTPAESSQPGNYEINHITWICSFILGIKCILEVILGGMAHLFGKENHKFQLKAHFKYWQCT